MTTEKREVFPGMPVDDVSEKYSVYEWFSAISEVESYLRRGRAKLQDIEVVEKNAAKLQEHAAYLCELVRKYAVDADSPSEEFHDDFANEFVKGSEGLTQGTDSAKRKGNDPAEPVEKPHEGFLSRVNDVCFHFLRN